MSNIIKLGKKVDNARILKVEEAFETAKNLHKEHDFDKCIVILQKTNKEGYQLFRIMSGMGDEEMTYILERVKFDMFEG